MKWYHSVALAFAITSSAFGYSDVKTVDTSKPQPAAKNELPPELQGRPPLTKQTKIELIRTMNAFEELRAEEGNGTNVSVVKSALQLMGQDCGHVRPPGAWPLTERQSKELRSRLTEWGLLSAPRAVAG